MSDLEPVRKAVLRAGQQPRPPECHLCLEIMAPQQLDKNDTPYVTKYDPTAININDMTQKNGETPGREHGYLRSTACTFRSKDVLRAAFAHMVVLDDVEAFRGCYLQDEITFDEDIKDDTRVCFACRNGNIVRVEHASKGMFPNAKIILDWPAAAITDTGSCFVKLFRRNKTKKVATADVQMQRTVTLQNLRRQVRNIVHAFGFDLQIISPAEVARDLFHAAFLKRIGIDLDITADSEDMLALWQQGQMQKRVTDDACAQRLIRLMMDVMHSSASRQTALGRKPWRRCRVKLLSADAAV